MSPKGDGRYIISNGKDQALRLWDLRRMRSSDEFDKIGHNEYHIGGYDYRYVPLVLLIKRPLRESINRQGLYLKPRVLAHPKDCSVMTYRGHAVLRTLIRCYFSPVETTGGQYLYSGSYDGKIRVSISFVTTDSLIYRLPGPSRFGRWTVRPYRFSIDLGRYQWVAIRLLRNRMNPQGAHH